MNQSDLKCAINLIYESDNAEAINELFEWLRPGRRKDALQTLFDLVGYQDALIRMQNKELIDLRIENSGQNQKFYAMSFTPRKRY